MTQATPGDLDVLHIEDLADSKCSNPECGDPHCTDIMFLSQGCHSGVGFEVKYVKESGTLHLLCFECDSPVAIFQIAHLPPGRMQ